MAKLRKKTEDLPNIVIMVPDEMRGDVINNEIVKIPNIDSIREDGVTFTNNFSVNPVCGPSRCCTFTGQYPHNGGHRSLYQLLRENDENLLKFLKKKGYEVIWIGRNDLLYKNAAKKSVTKYVSSVKLMLKALFPVIPHKFRLLRALKKKSWDIVMKIIGPFFKINPFSRGYVSIFFTTKGFLIINIIM